MTEHSSEKRAFGIALVERVLPMRLREGMDTWPAWVNAVLTATGTTLVGVGVSVWSMISHTLAGGIIVLGVSIFAFGAYAAFRHEHGKRSFQSILDDINKAHYDEKDELQVAHAKEINDLKSSIGQIKKQCDDKISNQQQIYKERLARRDVVQRSMRRVTEEKLDQQAKESADTVNAFLQIYAGLALNLAEKIEDISTYIESWPPQLASQLVSVREAILTNTRYNVGPTNQSHGTRTVLFEVNDDLQTLGWGMEMGRSRQRTKRVFGPGNPTYDLAIARKPRNVPDVSLIEDEDKDKLDYLSFATQPVAVGQRLYGILTVDANCINGFSPTDVEQLRLFAVLLAYTFALDPKAKYISATATD